MKQLNYAITCPEEYKRLTLREMVLDGVLHSETRATFLHCNSLIRMKEYVGGIDSNSFYQYAVKFTEHVKDSNSNRRSIPLRHDVCISHISLKAFELFQSNNVIVFSLPV